jgi:hypothetical protein
MKTLTIAALLISSSVHAEEICDFEHQCYHGDLEHPDRVTPPPAPSYQRGPTVAAPHSDYQSPSGSQCRLMTISSGPEIPSQIVELCTIPDNQERIYRNLQHQRQAQENARNAYIPDIYVPYQPWRHR